MQKRIGLHFPLGPWSIIYAFSLAWLYFCKKTKRIRLNINDCSRRLELQAFPLLVTLTTTRLQDLNKLLHSLCAESPVKAWCSIYIYHYVVTAWSMEVDPLVMKALHHLVSRKPDSTEKLKKMLFESLGREYVPAQAVSISPWFISVHEIPIDCR